MWVLGSVLSVAVAGQSPAGAASETAVDRLAEALVAAKEEVARKRLLAEAAPAFTEALEHALVGRAEALENEGRWADAAAVYEIILALAEAAGDPRAAAEALRDLGYAAAERSEYVAAVGFQQRALRLAEELGDDLGQLKSNNNLGVAYSELGDLRESLLHYERALVLAGDGPFLVPLLTNLGAVHGDLGDYRAARAVPERALARAEATADPFDAKEPLNNLGAVYTELGDYPRALACFERFLKLAEESDARPRVALALNNIGNVLSQQRRYKEARDYLERSARLAAEIGDEKTQLLDYKDLGRLGLAEERLEDAAAFGEQCTSLARKQGSLESLWVCRAIVGTALRVLGRPTPARAAYEEAIEITEGLGVLVAGGAEQRTRFFEDKTASYYGMVMLLVDAGKPLEALGYAERVKGRVLLEVLRDGKTDLKAAMSPAERADEDRLQEAIVAQNQQVHVARVGADESALSAAQAKLEQARLEYEGFRRVLHATHPGLQKRRGELRPPPLPEVLERLGPNTAVVEYAIGNEAAFAFVVAGGSGAEPRVEAVRLDTARDRLAVEVSAFRRSLAERSPGYLGAARRLYDLLVRPLEALVGPASLVIVPDGPLWEMPFQALVREGRHLLELRALSYAPSLSVLAEMMRRPPPEDAGGLLAMGDPALGPGIAPLPESRKEVMALEGLYAPRLVFTGAAALEETWKREAPRAGVLHLASHGVLDDQNPMYSHVLLAHGQGSGEDGLLEAREILDLNLRAEIAVLSACETGRGRLGQGEGLTGMSWALFVAGCPATVVSHWKVDSASTTRLMLEFHRTLSAPGGVTKAEALRAAALTLLRKGTSRHPFYWAGFSVVGNNAPLRGR